MARNILLTSLNAMGTDLPVRFLSVQKESGFEYLDSLLDAEAGIKTVLSGYGIDEITVIGRAGSFDEGDEHSTYGLLQDRISQFADGLTQDRKQDDDSLPEEVREKLTCFIDDFRENNPELKNRELSRLFDELAQNDKLCESFWTALFEACPELCGDAGPCRQWVKSYLYAELEPSMKPELLPANKEVSMSFLSEAVFEDSGQWVDSMMNMEKTIVKDEEDINLYVVLNSDDAADTFIVLNILDILISMPESKVSLKKIFTVRSLQRRMAGIVRDDTDGFGVTELFHAIRAFLNYGKADMIVDIWKKSGETNESIANMVYALRDVDVGLSMCNIPEVERGIYCLRELFRNEKFWRESGYYGVLFSLIAESIREDYGVLLEGDGDINFIEMVKWAYRHQFYQQTLTLIESRTPENLVKSGIFYYCDEEAHRDHVLRLFVQQHLRLRPYEFYIMEQIDHYFIKNYDRYRVRGRGAGGKDPRHAYAVLRTESVRNREPSRITGFTACDNLETLQDVLYAYYHVGFVRNKISHADAKAMEMKNEETSGSDEISALAWMRNSIDLFIESYEKAAAEVQGKDPSVIIISADDVRKNADIMRQEAGRRHRR